MPIRSPVIGRLIFAAAAATWATAAIAQGDAGIRQKAEVCAACHGPNGNSTMPQYPVLAGQSWRYVYIQLKDFKEGRRTDPQMSPLAATLERDDMIALGQFFAAQKPAPIKFKADSDRVATGKKISDAVLCPMCHLGGFIGQNEIPKVAGQYPEYVKKQLNDFKARRRTNDAGSMTSIARTLSDEDIENLSHYIGNLN
ncbi:MAG: c-type cytochrome [Betaproteobacteria bacterium]